MNQQLIGGPEQEGSYNVSIDDIGQLVVLPGEAPDVLTKSFPRLLSTVFEIPQVPRMLVCALEVSLEDLF